MSTQPNSVNPLSYIGVVPAKPAPVTFQDRAPTIDDNKNFSLSTIWLDRTNDDVYMLVDKSQGIATWTNLGGGTQQISTLTMPDLTVVVPVANNVNFLDGTGISITGTGDDVTISASGAGTTWTEVLGTTQAALVDNGYIANNAGLVTVTLPSAFSVGDIVRIAGKGAGLYEVAANAGDFINFDSQVTSAGGSLSSNTQFTSLEVVGITENSTWLVLSSVGNFVVS